MRIQENKTINFVLVALIALAYLALYSFSTSPLYVNEGMDSCVFKTIGLGILKGKLPYVDIFDHKGPLLFYINALGLLVSRNYGIILLQLINLFLTLYFMYLTAGLYVSKRKSMMLVLLALFFYSGLISEGNQCEEWMLGSISVSLWLALKMVNERLPLTPLKAILLGSLFGVIFFIRSNDAVSTVGAVFFGLCLFQIVQKNYRQVLVGCLMFLLGFMIVAAPFVVLYCVRGTFHDLMYGLFGFNIRYTGGLISMLVGVLREKYVLLIVCVASFVAVFGSRRKKSLFIIAPMMLFSCILIGNHHLVHYYIVVIPLFLAVVGICAESDRYPLVVAMLCLLLVPTYPYIRTRNRNVAKCLLADGNRVVQDYYDNTEALFQMIPDEERDSVWNYNLEYLSGRSYDLAPFSLLYHNGIVQCNKVVLWWHYYQDSDLLLTDSIITHAPKWVVLDRDSEFLPDIGFIEQHYDLRGEKESIRVYQRKGLK